MKNQVREEEESLLGGKRGFELKLVNIIRSCRCIILLVGLLLSQVGANDVVAESSPWSMFQHDLQRSGRSPYSSIKQPIFKWHYFTNSYMFASPVIDHLGRIYVATEDGNLHIVSSTGEKGKIISIGVRIDSTPAISKEGNIYIGVSDGHVLCFNIKGESQWVYSTKSKIKNSSIAIAEDETIFIGCEDGSLHAINKDGSLKWKYKASSSIYSSPAISPDGIIYIGCEDGNLYAINKDGSLIFKKDVKKSTFSSPAIDSEGNVYIGASNRAISIITKDGLLSSIPLNTHIYSSPAISKDGAVYIGTEKGLCGVTNERIWYAKTGRIFNSTPAITSDGIIYVASFDGKIHAVEPKEGRIIWSYDIAPGATSLAINQDGTIYLGTRDRNLYAIGTKIIPSQEITEEKPKLPKIIKKVEKIKKEIIKKEEIKKEEIKKEEIKKEIKEEIKITPPASPSNLVANPISSTEILLTWQDNSDNELEFRIYRKLKDKDERYELIKSLPPNSNSFLDLNLTPATTYLYRVVAYNQLGFSEYSTQDEATTKELLPSLPPQPPTNLKVISLSATQTTLSWIDNSDNEEGFQIERKLGDGEYTLIKRLSADVMTFQDTDLKPQTNYSYRVAAYNNIGLSKYSNEVTVTTKALAFPPSAPKNLKIIDFSTTTVNLSWIDTSANEQGFKVERKIKEYTPIKTLPQNTTSFQDAGLTPMTSYSYRVLAFNEAGESDYSNEVKIITKSSPPASPTNLKAINVLGNNVVLEWQDNSDNELGFKLERRELKQTYTLISVIPTNTTTLEDVNVKPLTTYFYRICAYNNTGISGYSNEILIKTQDTLPQPPTNLQAIHISTNSVKLTWNDNSNNELEFKLERALLLQEYIQIKSLPPNTTSYVDNGVKKDTSYYYRIRASNKLGNSDYSNTIGIRTLDILPRPPTNLRGISPLSTQIELFWQDNSDNEVGFKIERRAETQLAYTVIAFLSKDTTYYQDSDLSPDTIYYYRVKAYNRQGDSEYSNILSITTLPVIPFLPTNLKINFISSNQINLSWVDNSDSELGFRVERKVEGGNYEEITIVEPNLTSYEDKYLEPNTTYYYRIRAYNKAGNSSYSNEQKATTKDIPPYPPSNLIAKPLSPTQVDLIWEDNSNNERGFKIERSSDGKIYSQIALTLANVTTYQDKDLLPNTTYYYQIKAYNLLGDSYYSNKAECKTLDVGPIPPTNLFALPIFPDKVNLTWQDNSDNELGFKIERKQKDGEYIHIDTVEKDITEYQDSGLLPNVTYTYRIQAYNDVKHSEYSNEAFTKITQTIPSPPSYLKAKPISYNEIKLTWQDNSDNEAGFKIERKLSNEDSFTQVAVSAQDTTSYQDVQLLPDTTYHYRIRAYSHIGDSNYSNVVSVKTHRLVPKPVYKIQPIGISDYVGIDSPKLSWTYITNNRIYRSNPVIDTQGRIYIGSEDGYLYCLSATGKLIWRYLTGGGINTSCTIGDEGVIYVLSLDKNLYAISKDGSLKWKYPIKFSTEADVVVAPNLAIHVFTWDGRIYSIHPDGRLRWISHLGDGMIIHTPRIDSKGNIYIGASGIDGGLFCLDSEGRLKWKYTDEGEAITSPAIDSNGNIYIGLNNILYCFNSEGKIQFKIDQKKKGWMKSTPNISRDGVIYYNVSSNSEEGSLQAITQNGEILWEYPIGWSSFEPIIDADGNIYVISKDYNLCCISKDGKLKWNYTINSKITTSPNIGKDGSIYVGANNGQVYAIGKGYEPPVAPSNVVTKVISSSQIDISWQDNSNDELGFIIERATPNESYTQIASLLYNITNYQDTDLSPKTTYYYRISAFNKNGTSTSSHAYGRTLKIPPPLLTEVSIIPLKTGGKLKLSWQKPKENAFSFSHVQIYRSIVKGKLGYLIADGIKETTYIDTDLVNDLPYYYTFFAFDIYGNKSMPSAQYVGIPKDRVLPEIIAYNPTGNKVSPEADISITFSEEMDKDSVIKAFSIIPTPLGRFKWEANKLIFTPTSDLSGNTTYTVSISTTARDISGNYLQKPLSWQFTTFNPSPIIWSYSPIDLSPTICEGESLTFKGYASDPDQNKLRYSWKLDGVEKSTDSSWIYTAGSKDAGTKTVILTITDGVSTLSQKWILTIIDKNAPPTLSIIKDAVINVGELLQFNVLGFDTDNDELIYNTSPLPEGASFSNKIFSWRPTKDQGGTYQIIFKVSDGKGGEETKKLTIKVNLPPTIE